MNDRKDEIDTIVKMTIAVVVLIVLVAAISILDKMQGVLI